MMMKQFNVRPLPRAVVFFLGAMLVFAACKKPEDNIGLELLDPADALGFLVVDTSTIISYSVLEDSVRTSGLSRNMLGSFNDPVFGTVNASTYTQVRLSTNNVGDGVSPLDLEVDSIVLSLVYDLNDPFYGNLHQQEFVVFELAEDLLADTTYYSKQALGVAPYDLIDTKKNRFVPDPSSPVVVGGDTLPPQLRIRLKDELGRKFLDEWGSTNLENNENFLQFFKGIQVLTNNGQQAPNQGAVLYFDLLDANSKLTLYYRNTLVGEEDTLEYEFDIDNNSARFSRVEQNYGQALWPLVNEHLEDSTTGRQLFFVQSAGGTRARLKFPFLMNHNDSGRKVVAKAELVVPVKDPFNVAWQPPPTLFVFRRSDDGGDAFLPDQFEVAQNINGIYNEDNKEYRFNISRYIQQVLNGTLENTGLDLVASNRGVSVSRVELLGPEDLDRPTKLILIFTEL